ncbi:PAS domain-containing sensor histidine kinase [Natronomonas halophila]|uniref:PAS domain-containing protein n=1 Tax=Natronomonas halophila TaxID=2747817 RepID=UPI0015B3B962|nr:PAS domain-containing sensor histidine kinase [Natronomonas halophila]QLD86190.1 PAS domain-containing sensor histidine kinase [Natronomonas halophila]
MRFFRSNDSEQRYRQLIEASPAPINLFDADGEVLWGNDAVVDLLGLSSRSELIGRSIFDFIDPDDKYTAKQELATVVGDKRSAGPTEMQLQRVDGETRSIRVTTAPGRYEGQDIGQAVIIDVTDLKNVQAELEAERQLIDDALDALQDVFYVITPGGDLKRWNDALLEVSGYDESEVREMHVEEFFVDADADRVSESIASVFAGGEDVIEATVVTKRGREIPFEFRKQRLVRDGEVVGLVGIGRDISERVARDQHLHAVDRLLQHHLRNKVNIVNGQADRLREGTARPSEVAGRIETASEQLLSLFDNHHEIVELLTEREPVEELDVVDVIESVVREVREEYPDSRITYDMPDSATAVAAPAVDKAIRELIENGIVHNDAEEPSVHAVVRLRESTVAVRVVDSAPEIPDMEYLPLDDFTSLTPTFHTSGLGLWFVHWITERSGGTLEFDRIDSGGNNVTLELQRPNGHWTA